MGSRGWRRALGVTLLATAVLGAAAPIGTDEVLRRHREARGGTERWQAVKSLELTGSQTTFSAPAPFRMLRVRPNLYRFEQTILRRPVVEAFDGQRAWWIHPFLGADWPLEATQPSSGVIALEAEFDTPLMRPSAAGLDVDLVGLEELDGQPAYKLPVSLGQGRSETWYLDPNSYLEMARISTTADFGGEVEKRSYFSDFRQVDGLVLPHKIEMEFGSRHEVLQIDKVRVNVDADAAQFAMPPPEGMGALKSIAGEWDLTIETRPHPRAPWSARQSRASISLLLGGAMIEERYSDRDQGVTTEAVRTWTYDRFQRVYRIAHTDTYTRHMVVLEGSLEEGRLTASDERTQTTWKNSDETFNTRVILHDITPDGFQVDTESSTDGGASWTTSVKHTYKRR